MDTVKKHNFRFSKKYGQNFIGDENLLDAIVFDAGISADDTVIEVGTGAGTLTRAIARKAKKVISFEIDASLRPVIDETLNGVAGCEVVFADVMDFSAREIDEKAGGNFKLVANLPYYITTPVIFKFLECENLTSATIMVQKEVAERMCAQQGPQYGALSVAVQLVSEPCIKRIVGRSCFTPQPSVDSAIVRLDVMRRSGIKDFALLKKLVRAAFGMRRKTLANNLIASFGMQRGQAEELLRRAGFSAMIRGENVTVDGFIALSNILSEEGEH